MVIDANYNKLLESNWDLIAKDEFSMEGAFISSPPPLNEVWLYKPE